MKKTIICVLVIISMTLFAPCLVYAEEAASSGIHDVEIPPVTMPETPNIGSQGGDSTEGGISTHPEDENAADNKTDLDTEAWGMIVTVIGVVLSIFTCVGIFVKKFGSVIALLKNNASSAQVASALKNASSDVIDAVQQKYDQITAQLKQSQENEKLLITVISIFMANVKINPSAKAEILKYLAGIKDCAGDVIDIVDAATAEIEKATAAAEQEAPETPALNKIESEVSKTAMMLG